MSGKAILRDGYIFIEHEYVSDVADILQRIDDAAELIKVGAPHRILVDARFVHRTWPVEQSTVIVDSILHTFPAGTRIALVLPPEIPAKASRVLGGLKRAGWQASSFAEAAEAQSWLCS